MPQTLLLFYKLLRIELLFTTFIPMILLLQAAKYWVISLINNKNFFWGKKHAKTHLAYYTLLYNRLEVKVLINAIAT